MSFSLKYYNNGCIIAFTSEFLYVLSYKGQTVALEPLMVDPIGIQVWAYNPMVPNYFLAFASPFHPDANAAAS